MENLFNKTNQFFGLRRNNPRSHCVPNLWLKLFHRRNLRSSLITKSSRFTPILNDQLGRMALYGSDLGHLPQLSP